MTSLQYLEEGKLYRVNPAPVGLEIHPEVANYIQYFDSTDMAALKGCEYVTLYSDGRYDEMDFVDDFPHVRLITNFGDINSGILDYEPGSGLYGDIPAVRNWILARHHLDRRARVYCDRNDCRILAPELSDLPHEWIIATLDNFPWAASQLWENLRTEFNTLIQFESLWGNQWKPAMPGSPYRDQSSCYRTW